MITTQDSPMDSTAAALPPRKTPTKAQWEYIKERLSGLYGSVELRIDGFDVCYERAQIKNRLVINTWVNGEMRGIWLVDKTEEATKFLFLATKKVYSKKFLVGMRKAIGKAAFEKQGYADAIVSAYTPIWNSFGALKAALLKRNRDIELILPERKEFIL